MDVMSEQISTLLIKYVVPGNIAVSMMLLISNAIYCYLRDHCINPECLFLPYKFS